MHVLGFEGQPGFGSRVAWSRRYTDIHGHAGDAQPSRLQRDQDGSLRFVGEASSRIHRCAIRHGGDSGIRGRGMCIDQKSRHARNIVRAILGDISRRGDVRLSDRLASHADVTMTQMLDRLSRADVVFFGEQHDDPETHRAEAETLDAICRLGRPVVLSLEMFERDVQPVLDDYLAGRIGESEFFARTRPWANYTAGYRRLVELARARHWPVVAANVPRPLASAVGRKGMAALDTHMLTRPSRPPNRHSSASWLTTSPSAARIAYRRGASGEDRRRSR